MPLFPFEEEQRAEKRGSDFDHEGFEAFWGPYPRKDARKDAIKAWNALRPSHELQCLILEALAWQCQQRNWLGPKRYIPLPASYLRGERWKDEPVAGVIVDRRSDWEKARAAGYRTSTERLRDGK